MYDTVFNNGEPPSSPSSISASTLPQKGIPFLDLNQTFKSSSFAIQNIHFGTIENHELAVVTEELPERVKKLTLKLTDCTFDSESCVVKACRCSLQTRMPLLIRQLTELFENNETSTVGMIRKKYALGRCIQYFNIIETCIVQDFDGCLNKQFLEVSNGLTNVVYPDGFQPFFRVSPWVASSLAVDLSLGKSAFKSLEGGENQLPLKLEVEPCVEFVAYDYSSVNTARDAAIPCKVEIEKCSHRFLGNHAGAGIMGESTVRVRLSPLDHISDKKLKVWGTDDHVRSLCIKEARAVQLNAYPPKPKSNVDLYTSYHHGDESVCITLVLQTYVTKNGETPDVHIEIFLSPPQSV